MKLEFRTAGETLPPLPPTHIHTHRKEGIVQLHVAQMINTQKAGTESNELLVKLIRARLLLRLEYREWREGIINALNNLLKINTSVEKSCHDLIDVIYQK